MARPDGTESRRGVRHPAHRCARIQRVEICVVGPHLDLDRVLETDALEGLVPLQDAGRDGVAVLQRNCRVEPVDERLDGLGNCGRRVLHFQPPAVDMAHDRRARHIVAEVPLRLCEVTHPRISGARAHRLLGQGRDRIVQGHEQAARVGHGGRHRGHRRARWRAGLRHGNRAGREVSQHLQGDEVGLAAQRRDRRVARIEAVALTVGALQAAGNAEHVVHEQRVRLDQHRLGAGLRQARHCRAREQAGRERRRHRAAFGRAGARGVLGVARDHLHHVVDAAELDYLRPGHQPAEQGRFADAGGELGRQEEGLVEVFRLQLDPDLFVLLVQREQALGLLRVLDDGGKGRRAAGRRDHWLRRARWHARGAGPGGVRGARAIRRGAC